MNCAPGDRILVLPRIMTVYATEHDGPMRVIRHEPDPNWTIGEACVMEVAEGSGYSIVFLDSGDSLAWVQESEAKKIGTVTPEELAITLEARRLRLERERDLDWIISNWRQVPEFREHPPTATLSALAALAGFTNPWGARGEGVTLWEVLNWTHTTFAPVLNASDRITKEQLIAFGAEMAKQDHVRRYIRRYGCDRGFVDAAGHPLSKGRVDL